MENTIAALVEKNEAALREKQRAADVVVACRAKMNNALSGLHEHIALLARQRDRVPDDNSAAGDLADNCYFLTVALSDCHDTLNNVLDVLQTQDNRNRNQLVDDKDYEQIEYNLRVLRVLLPMVKRLGAGKLVVYIESPGWLDAIDFLACVRKSRPLCPEDASLALDMGEEAVAALRALERIPCKVVYNYTSAWRAFDVPPEFKRVSVVTTAGGVSQNATSEWPYANDVIIRDHVGAHGAGATEKRTATEYFREFQVIVDSHAYKGGAPL